MTVENVTLNVLNGSLVNVTPSDSFAFGNETDFESFESDFTKEIFVSNAVVNCTILPFLLVIGLFGNISTAIVFSRRKQKSPSTYFIIGLAFCDLFVLIFRLITNVYVVGHVYFTETFRYVKPNSFVWTAFSVFAQRGGNLYVLVIGIERFTAVWFPLRLRQIWTPRRACIAICIITLLTLGDVVIVFDVLLFSLKEKGQERGMLSTQNEAWRYLKSQSKIVGTLTFSYRMAFDLLPLPLVFICNVAIIIGINRNLFSKSGINAKTQERKAKEQRTTRMLLAVSMLYIVLCSPFNLYANLIASQVIRGADVPSAVYETFKMLNVLNSVINFIVYGINDKSLRKNYLKLWRCRTDNLSEISG